MPTTTRRSASPSTPTNIEIGAEGGTHNIKITADDSWIAQTNDPWITVSPANGRGTAVCQIIIDSALLNEPRQGLVRIQNQNNWEERRDINITQEAMTTPSRSTTNR